MSSSLLMTRRFAPLFWTQFFSAFSDNFLKNALVFLIVFHPEISGSRGALLVPLAAFGREQAGDMQAAWQALATGGHVVLMRHAATQAGVGDPQGFRKDDCSTQRNLSTAGKDQARQAGEQFKRRAIVVDAVWSSRWCRCLDTARLAFGQAQAMRMLDSMFNDPEGNDEAGKTAQLKTALAEWKARPGKRGNLVLVTHNAGRPLPSKSPASSPMLPLGLPAPSRATPAISPISRNRILPGVDWLTYR